MVGLPKNLKLRRRRRDKNHPTFKDKTFWFDKLSKEKRLGIYSAKTKAK